MEDGVSLAIGGTAVGSLVTLGCTWIKARCSKTKIEPDPLNVKAMKDFVTCEECRQHRDAIRKVNENLFSRMSTCEQGVSGLNSKCDLILTDLGIIKNRLWEK